MQLTSNASRARQVRLCLETVQSTLFRHSSTALLAHQGRADSSMAVLTASRLPCCHLFSSHDLAIPECMPLLTHLATPSTATLDTCRDSTPGLKQAALLPRSMLRYNAFDGAFAGIIARPGAPCCSWRRGCLFGYSLTYQNANGYTS